MREVSRIFRVKRLVSFDVACDPDATGNLEVVYTHSGDPNYPIQ